MRSRVLVLLAGVALASCGGEAAQPAAPVATLGAYAATTNGLCSQLAAAVRRTFRDAPGDPVAALARYARDVRAAGKRFAQARPPASLERFHARAVRHLARESAALRRAAELSAAGDPAAALRALHVTGLLPDAIPERVLRGAPACRGAAVPATPHDGDGVLA